MKDDKKNQVNAKVESAPAVELKDFFFPEEGVTIKAFDLEDAKKKLAAGKVVPAGM